MKNPHGYSRERYFELLDQSQRYQACLKRQKAQPVSARVARRRLGAAAACKREVFGRTRGIGLQQMYGPEYVKKGSFIGRTLKGIGGAALNVASSLVPGADMVLGALSSAATPAAQAAPIRQRPPYIPVGQYRGYPVVILTGGY